MKTAWLIMQAWEHRQQLVPILLVVLAIPLLLVVSIAGVTFSITPLATPQQTQDYSNAATSAKVQGITAPELTVIDAVAHGNDFSQVTPETIAQTLNLFIECEYYTDPETGEETEECSKRSFEEVMNILSFSPDQKEQARVMLATMTSQTGEPGAWVFTPNETRYTWPVAAYRITSDFGARADPETGAPSYHYGVDIGCNTGTTVMAAADGTVTETGQDELYGLHIYVEHDSFRTLYAHLSVISVSEGDSVTRGQTIGYSGSTGYSTGPHLHFQWESFTPSEPAPVPENPLPHYG